MRLRTGMAAAALFTGALVSIGGGSPASAAPVADDGPRAMACGYYETMYDAFYGHCGTGRIMIQVDRDWTPWDTYQCVNPGETKLGTVDEIDNAWAIGQGGC